MLIANFYFVVKTIFRTYYLITIFARSIFYKLVKVLNMTFLTVKIMDTVDEFMICRPYLIYDSKMIMYFT